MSTTWMMTALPTSSAISSDVHVRAGGLGADGPVDEILPVGSDSL